MTESTTDADVLAAIVKGGSVCMACGEKPVRLVGNYPTVAIVACPEGHQWEIEVSEEA